VTRRTPMRPPPPARRHASPRGDSDPELVELTFLIGFIDKLNLFNNCLQVRYNGEYSVFKEPPAEPVG
jgi:hypothetical protein